MWRGQGPELCDHAPCRGRACFFERAPVFSCQGERDEYAAACRSQASNPARQLFHGTSLLTSWTHVEERIVKRRTAVLAASEDPAGCREFFVNKRDSPIFLQGTAAVLSQYTTEEGDRGMPNLEDYRRCFPGYYFGRQGRPEPPLPAPLPWEQRVSCAVFRGGATGEGITPDTNPRLRAAWLSQCWRRSDERCPKGLLLDAKLTSWNQRQKFGADGVLRVLDPHTLAREWGLKDVGRHNYLSWGEQARCKYALYLPGNVGAGRLGALFGMGFVVLAPPSAKPATYLCRLLEPWINFIPLEENLTDLRDVLLWLRDHDDQARVIANRGVELHTKYCSHTAIEGQMRVLVSSLPAPHDGCFEETLEYTWFKARSAVYVLLDEKGVLRIFAPFVNPEFRNAWSANIQTEDVSMRAFLLRVRQLTGERVTLPLFSWWRNCGLACNVVPHDLLGESMLPELQLLLENL